MKWYIGDTSKGVRVFTTKKRITKGSFPFYRAVIGPFDTQEAADAYVSKHKTLKKIHKAKRKKNPNRQYHEKQARGWSRFADREKDPLRQMYARGAVTAHEEGVRSSRRRGNPTDLWYLGVLPGRKAQIFSKGVLEGAEESGLYSDIFGPFSLETLRRIARSRGLTIVERRLRPNPPKAEVLYDNITAIEAEKGQDSLWPGEAFRHDFTKGAQVLGLPGGDVLIRSKKRKRLWRKFDY